MFSSWKNKGHNEAQLYAIPLTHSYHRKSVSRITLKGVDRKLADIIISLLGDFAEIHLATVTEYVGYNEDDRAQAFIEIMKREQRGRNGGQLNWTEYFAGNWSNLNNLKLNLPPLRITVPDEFVGVKDDLFEGNIKMS